MSCIAASLYEEPENWFQDEQHEDINQSASLGAVTVLRSGSGSYSEAAAMI